MALTLNFQHINFFTRPNSEAVFLRLWQVFGMLILAVLLARWTWTLFKPQSATVNQPVAEINFSEAEKLFGEASARIAESAQQASDFKGLLVGAFSGKKGFAIFKLDDKHQKGVAVGEEIEKGVRLLTVAEDHAILLHDGVRQRVNLQNSVVASAASSVSELSAKTTPSATVSPPVAEEAVAEWQAAMSAPNNVPAPPQRNWH